MLVSKNLSFSFLIGIGTVIGERNPRYADEIHAAPFMRFAPIEGGGG